ncbi:DUF4291 domain-containing protein [Flammeovirga sp. EKP202]|uniref:DUF4291 domain-containing protein n=1 Tax=Flammeovirga sp. EKP202 TaxID=2770592 RepID=UPI0016600406|nr:DUF4291 domain-containing protein [Flammeovirga sp. EKP202]MBD0403070.1 DUF4291 domain-containing protein [Flammeovirga sp. EKP202]
MKEKEIRAVFDQETITVYQAYRPEIAIPAVKNQKFVPPFKLERMTWIKPSFLWMMYRCGWTQKEGQEHVLAIKIKREGWEWAMQNACISHFDPSIHASKEEWKQKLQNAPVRIQWDPERNINLERLEYRAIQVGLSGDAVFKYVNEWIVEIKDISDQCRIIHQLVMNKEIDKAKALLPQEKVYE